MIGGERNKNKDYFLTCGIALTAIPETEEKIQDVIINDEEKTIKYRNDKDITIRIDYSYGGNTLKSESINVKRGKHLITLNKLMKSLPGENSFDIRLTVENGSINIEAEAIDAAIYGTQLYKNADKEVY